MAKAKRIKKLKTEQRQKADQNQNDFWFLENTDLKTDFFIVTIPGVGSFNVTEKTEKRRLAS